MKTEKFLQNLRRGYEETEPPVNFKLYGEWELMAKIDAQKHPETRIYYRLAFAGFIALVLIVLSTGVYKTALAAIPGNPFYPVKTLGETVVNKATGTNQASIDNRASEIVTMARQDGQNQKELESVVSQYIQSVQTAPAKNSEYAKRLSEQHRQFDQLAKDSPQVANYLKGAIEISEPHDSEKEDSNEKGD